MGFLEGYWVMGPHSDKWIHILVNSQLNVLLESWAGGEKWVTVDRELEDFLLSSSLLSLRPACHD